MFIALILLLLFQSRSAKSSKSSSSKSKNTKGKSKKNSHPAALQQDRRTHSVLDNVDLIQNCNSLEEDNARLEAEVERLTFAVEQQQKNLQDANESLEEITRQL